MNTSTRIALILFPIILIISLIQSVGSKPQMAERTPTLSALSSDSKSDSLNHAQSGVVRESEKSEPKEDVEMKDEKSKSSSLNSPMTDARLRMPLHERLFPKSRVISEEQFGPNDEGVITKIQLLETNFKYSLIRLEQRWKGDEPLPPVAMVANHIMIERKEGMSDADFRKAIDASGLTIDKMLPDSDVYIISFNAHDVHAIEGVLDHLAKSPDSIGVAEPDYIRFVN